MESARIVTYLAGQSAGQCGPCVYGLPAIADDLTRLARGEADAGLLGRLDRRLREVDGRGACRHPDGAVQLARSALRCLRGRCGGARGRDAVSVLEPGVAAPLPGRRRDEGPAMIRILVDPVACDAYGYCAELLPEAITLDEWGYPVVDGTPLPPELVERRPARRPGLPPARHLACGSARAVTEADAGVTMAHGDGPSMTPHGLVIRPADEADLGRMVELLVLGAVPGGPPSAEDPDDLGPYRAAWRDIAERHGGARAGGRPAAARSSASASSSSSGTSRPTAACAPKSSRSTCTRTTGGRGWAARS